MDVVHWSPPGVVLASGRQMLRDCLLERRTDEDMLRSCREEIARLETHNEQLRAQMDLIEHNIARLPVNAAELYRAMPKPHRSVAHSGRRKKRGLASRPAPAKLPAAPSL